MPSNFKFRNVKFENTFRGFPPFAYFKSQIVKFQIAFRGFSVISSRLSPLCLCVSVAVLVSACGYRVAGTSSRLPAGLKVIAVPTIENRTNRYRIEQVMTEALVHEFLARTKYRIVTAEGDADAVLHAEINSFDATPVVFDTTPGPKVAGEGREDT